MTAPRQYRAGQSVEDYCRQCHEDRIHTVIVVDAYAQPLRVTCDFCRSEHNFRGGPRNAPRAAEGSEHTRATESSERTRAAEGSERTRATEGSERARATESSERAEVIKRAAPALHRTVPYVSSPETRPMANTSPDSDFEATLRRVIREETGLTPVAPAEKWRGGQLVLRPGRPGVQEKAMPIDAFFNKIVMLRNRLRTLEQQVNASDLPDDQKLKLQGYITGCYGSLTSFNVLFANDEDRFVGTGGE
jgi:hypothetical protein